MQALEIIEVMAGYDPNNNPIVERLQVEVNHNGITDDTSTGNSKPTYKLVRSPAFIKGIASGDLITFDNETKEFEIQKRSGNLSLRIFSRGDTQSLSEHLTPQLEKLGGQQDLETERMLVYSIHVSCGFNSIEEILNQHIGEKTQSMWQYGNVYDPTDGETPLNWWIDILKPQ
ncbi:MAG: DUF4265 domain-containing protein [Cellvibrionaceae bacterium]